MAEDSKIEWTHATFNPWEGCSKVSPGCANCYAEARANRFGTVQWGPQGTRRIASKSYWRQPIKWDREAAAAGERRRVFCASLADVFEDRPELAEPRKRLLMLIHDTPRLDWLLLTKRPENVLPALDAVSDLLREEHLSASACWVEDWMSGQSIPANVWLGVSVENQQAADERIPILLKTPAKVRFLSCEPLLSAVDLRSVGPLHWDVLLGWKPAHEFWPEGANTERVDWVIVGGESGPHARPMNLAWARSIVQQCQTAGVPVFVKQLGANIRGLTSDGLDQDKIAAILGSTYRFRDPKGGNMEEWPEDLRIRQFPTVA